MAATVTQKTMVHVLQLPKNLEASLKRGHQEGILIQAMVLDKAQTLQRCRCQCQGHTQGSTSCDKKLKKLALLSLSLKEDYPQLSAVSTHRAPRISTL